MLVKEWDKPLTLVELLKLLRGCDTLLDFETSVYNVLSRMGYFEGKEINRI